MASCAPVKFCSPPNWAVDFPDLIGPQGPQGVQGTPGTDGLDAPTELKASLFGPIQDLEAYTIDCGSWQPYQVYGLYAQLEVGSAVISITIDGAPIPGLTSITVDTNKTQFLATASNTVSVGGKLEVLIESAPFGTKSLAISIKTQQIVP